MERPTEKTVDGLSWSEWEISWVVVRLGSSLAEQVALKIQQQLQEAGTGSSTERQLFEYLEGCLRHKSEIVMFEAARAHAASDGRLVVDPADIQAIALLALRQRQSPQLAAFFDSQEKEDGQLLKIIDGDK